MLLLHELEHLLELAPQPLHARAALLVAPRLATCIASDNSRVAERALSIFSSEGARAVLLGDVRTAAPLLLPALLRGFTPHWNQTVNRMTHEVLSLVLAADGPAFAAAAEQLCGEPRAEAARAADAAAAPSDAAAQSPLALAPPPHAAAGPSSGHAPMRAPWAAAGARGASGAPPGASPMLRGVGFLRPGGARFDAVSRMPVQACAAPRQARAAGGSAAPEADFSLDLTQVSEAASRVGGTPGASPATPAAPAAAPAAPIAPGAEAQPPTPPELPSGRGVARVLKFLEQLKPPSSSSSAPPPSPSVREHLTEAPMLLPSIIFQDLVFGADLGSGSFSTVRAHARTHTRYTHTHNCSAVCTRACTTT